MRNKFEHRVADALGPDWSYEPFSLTYTIEHSYTPDFVNGTDIVEAKGYLSPDDRRKMVAVKKQNPTYRFTILFQNPNLKLSKRSKTTYWQWAERNGFEWRAL